MTYLVLSTFEGIKVIGRWSESYRKVEKQNREECFSLLGKGIREAKILLTLDLETVKEIENRQEYVGSLVQ